jgi:hypothetical protein
MQDAIGGCARGLPLLRQLPHSKRPQLSWLAGWLAGWLHACTV